MKKFCVFSFIYLFRYLIFTPGVIMEKLKHNYITVITNYGNHYNKKNTNTYGKFTLDDALIFGLDILGISAPDYLTD